MEVFDDRQPEERLRRVWRGIQSRRERRNEPGSLWGRFRLLVTAASVSCLVIVSAFAWKWLHSSEATRVAAATIPASIEPGNTGREVDFGDGAQVTVGTGARLDVLEQTPRAVVLALRRGLSQYDIRPGGTRAWRIESGGVSVEVVGTRFSVERNEKAVRVEVLRGKVLVRGQGVPDQVQALGAGQSLLIELATKASSPSAVTESEPIRAEPAHLPPDASVSKPSLSPSMAARPTAQSNDWRRAATQQDWTQAWETLGKDGVAREAAHTDDVADLLALADIARLSGHPDEALTPLRQIVGNHTTDPRSSMAAFTLGRVLLDSLRSPVQAAFAFEKALSLKLPSSLAEDAQARLVEAHAQSGALAQARAAAQAYRVRYPGGRRLADVNHWSPPE
jgi:transmembrane sensor